jgi:hypothetical protein
VHAEPHQSIEAQAIQPPSWTPRHSGRSIKEPQRAPPGSMLPTWTTPAAAGSGSSAARQAPRATWTPKRGPG